MARIPPPTEPLYGRYYGYWRRPYRGCGCLYLLLVVLLIWLILAIFIDTLRVFWF